MNARTPPPARSGATSVLFVFCLAALLLGLGFDLGAGARLRFWIGDQPAAAAAVGVAGILFAVLAAMAARFVFGRRQRAEEESKDVSSSHS